MKFNKKTLSESIQAELVGTKTFTEGKRQDVVISEEQLERLLLVVEGGKTKGLHSLISETFEIIRNTIVKENLDLNIEDYSETIISESQDEWRGHNPGVSAAAGIENIINSVKKAYDMIKDSDTRRKLANSITKLGNFMSYTAELMGSGASQRAPRSYEDVSDDLPYPEFDESSEEVELEVEEGHEPGHEEDVVETAKEEKERLIKEDIKKMKQVIKPISRI